MPPRLLLLPLQSARSSTAGSPSRSRRRSKQQQQQQLSWCRSRGRRARRRPLSGASLGRCRSSRCRCRSRRRRSRRRLRSLEARCCSPHRPGGRRPGPTTRGLESFCAFFFLGGGQREKGERTRGFSLARVKEFLNVQRFHSPSPLFPLLSETKTRAAHQRTERAQQRPARTSDWPRRESRAMAAEGKGEQKRRSRL